MLKLALVSLQFEGTTTGGGGVHVEKVAEQLVDRGHEVTVLSIHTNATWTGSALTDWRVPYSREVRDDLSVVRFLIEPGLFQPYDGDRETELARIKIFCDTVTSWLEKRLGSFNIVHLHGHHLIPGYLAHKLKGKGFRVVSTIHFLESTLLTADPEAMAHFRVAEQTLTNIKQWEAMVRYADVIVSVSPQGKEDLFGVMRELGPDLANMESKTHVISSGVDSDVVMTRSQAEAKLGQSPHAVELVIFSRLDPSKGVHLGIRGIAEAAGRTNRRLKLTVAGIPASRPYLNLLQEEIQQVPDVLSVELRTFDRVFSPQERNEFLDRFHVYLLPSLNEPFGMTLIEAGARGLRLIATDTAGPLYILEGDGMEDKGWGYVTPCGICAKRTAEPGPNLASNLGKAIAWTLEHWGETGSQVTRFLAKIGDRFTWDEVAEEYLKVYRG
jgi:glycosyltransferase involved in cell wall biosynthesis